MTNLLFSALVLSFSLASANDQKCEKLAVSAVKSNYPGMFKADEDGYRRYVAFVVCKPVASNVYCAVGTKTSEADEYAKFEVVLNAECTKATKVKLPLPQDN